jgi:hypothetical protein
MYRNISGKKIISILDITHEFVWCNNRVFRKLGPFLHSDGKRGGGINFPDGLFRKSRSLFLDTGYNNSSVNWPYLKLPILTGS